MNQHEFDEKLHKLYDAIHNTCNQYLPKNQKLDIVGSLNRHKNLNHFPSKQKILDVEKELRTLENDIQYKKWYRLKTDIEISKMQSLENKVGGFWYGNVPDKYISSNIQYCEKWKEVNSRVHAFFNYECVMCHVKENGKSHMGHHVFYVKEACCWYTEDGVYYTNLNAQDHSAKDYCIGENPNYFVILCSKCHGKTNGNFANRKKWADHFRELVDTKYGGKCYFTKDEMNEYLRKQAKEDPGNIR